MPFIDATGQLLLRSRSRLLQVERLLATAGRWVLPTALALLILSGLALSLDLASPEGMRADTLRGLHHLGALLLGTLALYRALSTVRRLLWRWLTRGWPSLPALPKAFPGWAFLARAGFWGSVALLAASGGVDYLNRTASSAPPGFGDPAFWGVLHAVVAPYAYGFGVLVIYVRLRRQLPALRDYLIRHY